jgi:hypothetical protein
VESRNSRRLSCVQETEQRNQHRAFAGLAFSMGVVLPALKASVPLVALSCR